MWSYTKRNSGLKAEQWTESRTVTSNKKYKRELLVAKAGNRNPRAVGLNGLIKEILVKAEHQN